MSFLFTSESVTCGHPDKICDQISDAILDEALRQDPHSRVAVETAVKTGMAMVFGEMRTTAWVDVEKIVRDVVHNIGYTHAKYGLDFEAMAVLSAIGQQSSEIAQGVDETESHELGAGDQGMMFGYACQETKEFMPLPITLAHRLTRQAEEVRKEGICPFLRPDGKSQVTVEYDDSGEVKRVHTVVISLQHTPDISQTSLSQEVHQHIIEPILSEFLDSKTLFHINPTGSFVIGGPQGDSGLTGRKIIVDTYGGSCPHGGGAFSGKDSTKVDRTGAYAARHIAKNIVAANLAKKCQVQLAYAIGVSRPVSVFIETFGTGTLSDRTLEDAVQQIWDLRPSAMISHFDLRKPIFQQTAVGGHFGRNEFSWENTEKVSDLLQSV
ncbi:methionine adenosyltransferase [Candidatus Peregrinibacteria bacterium]|nr:MAG: methionine adenosyltransferase [Candidatus Peregrinibacteria bacterium]